jgi:hypothetical protein
LNGVFDLLYVALPSIPCICEVDTSQFTTTMESNKALIWKSFDLWSLITRFYSPFPLRWDRKLKLFKGVEVEGSRLKLIRWLLTIPLVFIPFIFGSILFFMRNIQEGRSSTGNLDVFTFYLEVIVALGVLVMSSLGCAMVIVYFLYGKQLLLSFNYIKELHEQLLLLRRSTRSPPEKERNKGLAIALIIVVIYTLGILPHAVVIQFTYMNLDPWYVLLKATGQGDILDPKNYSGTTYFYWIYLLLKLLRGYVFWVGLCEVLRMTMLYSLIGLVLPIMLNDCMIFLKKECYNNNAGAFGNRIVMMNCIRSSIKTRRYMRIYKELQIVMQNMAQAQALASTGILSAVFIVTVFGNFIVVRLSDLLPVYFSVNTVIGLCSSAFSVNLSMKVCMVFHENSIEVIKGWRDNRSWVGTRNRLAYKRSLALRPLRWFIGTGMQSHNLGVIDRGLKKKYFMAITDKTITALLAVHRN